MAQDLLERLVGQADLVDSSCCFGEEQVRAQGVERQAVVGAVAAVDELEEGGEGVIEVRALLGLRRGQLDEDELAEPVEGVPLVIIRRARRQDLQLGEASAKSRNRMR